MVRNLSFSYEKGRMVFSGVTFSVNRSEIYTILGSNGAGKSTLLSCLAGMARPNSGEIWIDDVDIRGIPVGEYALKVGFVSQSQSPSWDFLVQDYLLLGCAPYIGFFNAPGRTEQDTVERIMERMQITHLADKSLQHISGGERQQVQIARALVQKPRLILMDEPTNHLDWGNQLKVLKVIVSLAEEDGVAVIMTTHIPAHAILLDARAGILDRRGQFVSGSTEEILTQENLLHIYEADLCMTFIPEVNRRVCIARKIR
jgi:iron complex transport system ATP-binding protein